MNAWTLGSGFRLPLAVGFFVAAFLFAVASPAWAASMTVTTANDELDGATDNGECSLREAIENANADAQTHLDCPTGSGGDTIGFASSVTGEKITLTVGATTAERQLLITDADGLTINGPGADVLSVSADEFSRVFTLVAASSENEINGLTIENGSSDSGGGVSNEGNLTLAESVVSGNAANDGGGIRNAASGTMKLIESTVSDNETDGNGGGIFNAGILTVSRSTVSGNTALLGGGVYSETEGIANGNSPEARTSITNSTISGNDAELRGGGVRNVVGLTVIKNSTITKNTADPDEGGGVASSADPEDRTEVFSSIIAGNTDTDVDSGTTDNTFQSNGHNLIGDGNATGAFTAAKRDQTGNTDPGLGLLAENGGPTMTHEVEATSPALDKGKSGGLTNDQRGEDRPSEFPAVPNAIGGDGADIGAFERQAPNPLGCTKFGTPGNDNLVGTSGRDVICGFGGNDVIKGLAGNDTLLGGPGKDKLFGGPGKDKLIGGPGKDKLVGGPGKDKVR